MSEVAAGTVPCPIRIWNCPKLRNRLGYPALTSDILRSGGAACPRQCTILSINVERPMNKVFLAIPLCLALSGIAVAEQRSAREQIVGAWTLVSVTSEMDDGKKGEPFGPA